MIERKMLVERVIAAVVTVDHLRSAIEENGGKYHGGLVPNLQTIVDILTMPQNILNSQIDTHREIFTDEQFSDSFKNALEKGWDGK